MSVAVNAPADIRSAEVLAKLIEALKAGGVQVAESPPGSPPVPADALVTCHVTVGPTGIEAAPLALGVETRCVREG